jgi:hypothetical protein
VTFDAAIPEAFVQSSCAAAVNALDRHKPNARRLVKNALKLATTPLLSSALIETLAILSDGRTRTTTEVFAHDLCWVGKSALRARLGKLETLGLVRRVKGSGRRADSWTVTSKGVIVGAGVRS